MPAGQSALSPVWLLFMLRGNLKPPTYLRCWLLLALLYWTALSGLAWASAMPPSGPAAAEFTSTLDLSACALPNTTEANLYTGQQFDPDLGLYYLRARYHNPDSGRFWTADAFEGFASDPGSLHRYTYCHNNPVNCVDPSGYTTSTEALTTTSISLTARIALAGVMSAYSGLVNALDVAVASNFTANSQQLADAYRQGYIAGAVFAGGALSGVGWLSGTTTVVGLTLGGLGVGDAIAGGRPDLVITRMTSIAVGVGGAYRLTAALTEFYSRPVSVRSARPPAQPAEEFIDDFHVNSTSEPLPPTARSADTVAEGLRISPYRVTRPGETFIRYESADPAFTHITPSGGVTPRTFAALASDGVIPAANRITVNNLPSRHIPRPNSFLLAPPPGTLILGPRPVAGGTGNEVMFPMGF